MACRIDTPSFDLVAKVAPITDHLVDVAGHLTATSPDIFTEEFKLLINIGKRLLDATDLVAKELHLLASSFGLGACGS
jgi:hypothetical protein